MADKKEYKEYKVEFLHSWLDKCMRCGKSMRVSHTGNHYCHDCRKAHKFNTGHGLRRS